MREYGVRLLAVGRSRVFLVLDDGREEVGNLCVDPGGFGELMRRLGVRRIDWGPLVNGERVLALLVEQGVERDLVMGSLAALVERDAKAARAASG